MVASTIPGRYSVPDPAVYSRERSPRGPVSDRSRRATDSAPRRDGWSRVRWHGDTNGNEDSVRTAFPELAAIEDDLRASVVDAWTIASAEHDVDDLTTTRSPIPTTASTSSRGRNCRSNSYTSWSRLRIEPRSNRRRSRRCSSGESTRSRLPPSDRGRRTPSERCDQTPERDGCGPIEPPDPACQPSGARARTAIGTCVRRTVDSARAAGKPCVVSFPTGRATHPFSSIDRIARHAASSGRARTTLSTPPSMMMTPAK